MAPIFYKGQECYIRSVEENQVRDLLQQRKKYPTFMEEGDFMVTIVHTNEVVHATLGELEVREQEKDIV